MPTKHIPALPALLMTALLCLCAAPAAHAENTAPLSPEAIKRIYLGEMKLEGKTLRCFQAGKEILSEMGLRNVSEGVRRIGGTRLDGSGYEVLLSDDTSCIIVTRSQPAP